MKKIRIDELQPGMFVQGIVKQKGNMKIKSQGKVNSEAIIEQLRNQGILEVLIDPSKAFKPDEPEEPEEEVSEEPVEELPEEPETPQEEGEKVKFDAEVAVAAKMHDKGKVLQKRMMDSVIKGLPVDISIPQEFSEKLVGSIDRNPNALMCMTKIREKDDYLFEHSLNVAILLANFAKYVGMPEEEVEELALSGFLHDIGKIKIPDEILHKPGRLTDQEMVVMRDHVYYGIRTLEQMEGMPDRIVRTMSEHHERLDGYGYPEGARGEEISRFGRMIAIVDTYDAITADRCYKPGMPSQKALKILLKESPEKYDRELVELFIKCVGIYPVGSLVQLNNGHVAMVVKQRPNSPLKPIVKVFFTIRGDHYISPKDVDLGSSQYDIEKAVTPAEFDLDFNRFFSEKIAMTAPG